MKTIGLIGGMSAESTTVYYQLINRLVRERLGGLHSAQIALWSLDFAPIAELQGMDDWAATGRVLADAARRLEGAGADTVLICANTMHLNYAEVAAATSKPVIHIADATAEALKARGVTKALLLATRFTMEKPFYSERLAAQGIATITPPKADRDRLHAIIYDELVVGVITEASRTAVLAMIDEAKATGCDGIIFGCTEIGLLLDVAAMPLATVDTAVAHCEAAVDFALA
ncbi:aspartate/glutamate racemase family protein [Phenylobacterium sp.]|jgi:aspartate racemase|uniref:aspartate/glutamate racemase family protein n=1 Tax=Phenylobacterium sp. TaxID=1871053 RepID=UPI00120A8DD3|nr:aspartate/glutamate racemase family protein [Phenylobacterium sp.]THD52229.1 MAG: aspartate/glutamate racemase family protein [Phenylobacterium sp.]